MGSRGAGEKYSTYRIESQVGSDTFGTLYRAYDEVLDRPVALKVLFPGLSAHKDLVDHFRKNIQELARLTHPRIPQIYYFGKQEGEYFVALEWCSGGSLSNELRRNGRMPLQRGLTLLMQCIEALAAAWKLGIAHGNLKPNNVMIDEHQEIKIADFGFIAETRHSPETLSVSGALNFMAPELADRRSVDFRSDIYSLGIIFHYMLLNSLPTHQPIERITMDDSQSRLLPVAVWKVIDKMTRENPEERYASYEELIQEIEKLSSSHSATPVPAVPKAHQVAAISQRRADSLFDLLAGLYRELATGVMKVAWLSVKKEFLIRHGEIVFFESNQPEESLASMVVSKKWLPQSELQQSTPDAESMIRRVLGGGGCTAEQFSKAYLKLMTAATYSMFHWPVFQGEFFPAEIEHEPFSSLRISDVLLEASRNLIDSEWVKARIPQDSLINRTPSFEQLLAPFPLNPEESFLAYRFEGEDITPTTLGMLTGLPEDRILRILYLLQRIGALELRSAAPRQPRRIARQASPPTSPPSPPKMQEPPPAKPEREPQRPEPSNNTMDQKPAPQPLATHLEMPPGASAAAKAASVFRKAEEACDGGNYGLAAHLCKEALQYHQTAEYYQLLGACYARHPRFQRDAEDAFHKAIALAPSDAHYHAVLALFYSQRDLWLRARTHCMKALELSPKHEMATKVFKSVQEQKPGKGDCWCAHGETNPTR